MNRLLAQNYREWTSKAGSKLLAKLVSASPAEVILMNGDGGQFRVVPEQLSILDRAWLQRQQKGTPWKAGELRMQASGETP